MANTKYEVQCEKCGKVEEVNGPHMLPLGWERLGGDDFCEECMNPINDALEEGTRYERAFGDGSDVG